ncbi:MAG: hypothetical protein HWE16_13375 [Gammaproteobacteria bacterium]|nr:hypothetical protein [Gammaproteobacteria bacterium]
MSLPPILQKFANKNCRDYFENQAPSICSVSCAHYNGFINLSDKSHLDRVFIAESDKRVKSFIFEALFLKCLKNQGLISTGWLYIDYSIGNYAFKLIDERSPISSVDLIIEEQFKKLGFSVTYVKYGASTNNFSASTCHDGVYSDFFDFMQNTYNVGAKVTPSNAKASKPSKSTVGKLSCFLTQEELRTIAISRLFINAYCIPIFEYPPIDIDAFLLIEEELFIVEFKRKYPAKEKVFGCDKHIYRMVNRIKKSNISFLHIILTTPNWDKNYDQIELLEQKNAYIFKESLWLAITLNPSSFAGHLHTQGEDSGMQKGKRTQYQVDVDEFSIIGEGYCFNIMKLNNSNDIPTYSTLEDKRIKT